MSTIDWLLVLLVVILLIYSILRKCRLKRRAAKEWREKEVMERENEMEKDRTARARKAVRSGDAAALANILGEGSVCDGEYMLDDAIDAKSASCVMILIESGVASVNRGAAMGPNPMKASRWVPLWRAINNGNAELVALLIAAGADLKGVENAKPPEGWGGKIGIEIGAIIRSERERIELSRVGGIYPGDNNVSAEPPEPKRKM